jgi:hypothetical protein
MVSCQKVLELDQCKERTCYEERQPRALAVSQECYSKVNVLRDSHKLLVTPNREFGRQFGRFEAKKAV